MPTYAYACSQCSHRFDIYQSFTEDALTTCPECGQQSLRKVFSSVGVVFKGSGFYRTDSRSSESASSPAAKSESKPAGSTSEAKPAAKSEKSASSSAPAKAAASS